MVDSFEERGGDEFEEAGESEVWVRAHDLWRGYGGYVSGHLVDGTTGRFQGEQSLGLLVKVDGLGDDVRVPSHAVLVPVPGNGEAAVSVAESCGFRTADGVDAFFFESVSSLPPAVFSEARASNKQQRRSP
jgi:hypothetical protein